MAPGESQSYPGDLARTVSAAGSHAESPIAHETTPFGAPVARPSGVPEPWLTPVDIAARLKVSRATVYGLLKSGALPHRRVGLSIRIAPADLDAYLQHQ